MVRKKFELHKENSQTHPGATIQFLTLTCIYKLYKAVFGVVYEVNITNLDILLAVGAIFVLIMA